MIFKVNGRIFDSERGDTPMMVVLSKQDKEVIKSMAEEDTKYCLYPGDWTEEEARKWVNLHGEEPKNPNDLKEYYVRPREINSFVKEGSFFESQGGLTDYWGRNWIKIEAKSLENAREIANEMYSNKEYNNEW